MTSTMNLAHVQGANGELEFQQVLNTLMFPNVNVGSNDYGIDIFALNPIADIDEYMDSAEITSEVSLFQIKNYKTPEIKRKFANYITGSKNKNVFLVYIISEDCFESAYLHNLGEGYYILDYNDLVFCKTRLNELNNETMSVFQRNNKFNLGTFFPKSDYSSMREYILRERKTGIEPESDIHDILADCLENGKKLNEQQFDKLVATLAEFYFLDTYEWERMFIRDTDQLDTLKKSIEAYIPQILEISQPEIKHKIMSDDSTEDYIEFDENWLLHIYEYAFDEYYSAMDGWRRYDKKSISIHEAFTLEKFFDNVSYVFEYLDKLH